MAALTDRLFDVLQRLKAAAPDAPVPGCRWWVAGRGTGREGPFHAAELAYLARAGRLRPEDRVADEAGRCASVAGHPSLARWMRGARFEDRRIVRALSACARAYVAALDDPANRGTATDPAVTPEQRRAFRLLQLEPGCSPREAKARLHALAARFHPDRGGSVERMQEITWAWSVVQKAVGR